MEITLSSEGTQRLIKPTIKDILLVKNLNIRKVKKGEPLNLKENIVTKPWGAEYLCGRNKWLEVWELYIKPKSATSLHCHPNKDTLNIVLEGAVQFTTIRRSEILRAGDFRLIKAGAIHKTANLNPDYTARVLEIESPPNKYDLIRVRDDYGRENLYYVKFRTKKQNKLPMRKCFLSDRLRNKKDYYTLRTFIPGAQKSKRLNSAVYELSITETPFEYPKDELLKEFKRLKVKNLILASGSALLMLHGNKKVIKLLPGNCLFDTSLKIVNWSARNAKLLLW